MKSGDRHTLQVLAVANSIQPLITVLGTMFVGVTSVVKLAGQVLELERVKVGLHDTQVQPPS